MYQDTNRSAIPATNTGDTSTRSTTVEHGAVDPRRLSESEARPSKATSAPLEDVQSRGDVRGIRLDHAGVAGVRYPATAEDPAGVRRPTVVDLEMSVAVEPDSKGTHMSRFLEVMQADERHIDPTGVVRILRAMQDRLEAKEAHISLDFPLFFEREAPASGAKGMVDVDCGYVGKTDGPDIDLVQRVAVTVTSLCPCSKEISDYGAHNQRGEVTIEVRTRKDDDGTPVTVPMGALIDAAEESASCRVYPILKRPDERWITMEAYENPVFVEDMVRGAAERLIADERIASFRVRARNFESIHGHDAFAETSWTR
ncbi:MAG: GTP cyclohydrolase FolE2 [Planctomycetota bacterium]